MTRQREDSSTGDTRSILAIIAAATILTTGCTHPVPPPQPVPTQAEQAATFHQLVQQYDRAARGGWTQAECREVSSRFVELSDRVGGFPEALFNAAMTLRHCGLTAEAAPLLERADASCRTRRDGPGAGFAPALVILGIDASRRGERDRAMAFFERARQADPWSADAYTDLATIQRETRQWSDAQQNLRRALAVDSDQMAAYTQMALLYLDLGEDNPDMLDMASLVCQQALSRATQTKVAPAQVAPIHNAWGLALVKTGDIVGAVGQFDEARTLDPRLFEAHLNFGSINLSFRGYEAAEAALRTAVELDPSSYEAHLSLGVALRGLRRYDDARAEYERALEIDSHRPGAHYNLGVLAQDYLFGEAHDEAEQVRLIQQAKQSFQRFLSACDASPGDCVRQSPGESEEDLRGAARRRIRDCDALVNALSAHES